MTVVATNATTMARSNIAARGEQSRTRSHATSIFNQKNAEWIFEGFEGNCRLIAPVYGLWHCPPLQRQHYQYKWGFIRAFERSDH